tara:strand:- start:664 stop:1293 length:630 start_codon:yes stop_codon:yes gene_type:complete
MDVSSNNLLSKDEVLLNSLYEFYKKDSNMNKILPIVTGNSEISLRVLDYFVTNYSKVNETKIMIDKDIYLNVFQDYKNKLKSYNKRFFDPFCRINKKNMTNKIAFKYDKDNFIITTIGQLNFFKWAITNKIINYVIENHKVINDEMNRMNKINKKTFKSVKVSKEVKNERLMNILDTTINFNGGQKQLKVKTTLYDNEEYNIAKLEFDK